MGCVSPEGRYASRAYPPLNLYVFVQSINAISIQKEILMFENITDEWFERENITIVGYVEVELDYLKSYTVTGLHDHQKMLDKERDEHIKKLLDKFVHIW